MMEIEETKTRLMISRKPKTIQPENKSEQQKKRNLNEPRIVQTICKPISSTKEFFLPHDLYIEFNQLDNDQSFQVYKSMVKQFRPLLSVTHLKKLKYLQVHLDQSHRGVQNFDFIIHQLNQLQNKEYHELANSLTEYKNTLQYLKSFSHQRKNPVIQQSNQKIFQKFIDIELQSILEEQDPYGFYNFTVMQCIDDLSDASLLLAGLNENFIKMMGSDVDSYYNLLMRQGWFDMTNYSCRNENCVEFIDIVKSLFQSNFDLSSIMVSDKLQFITLDGIKITAKIQPQIYFCFGEEEDNIFPGQKAILGYIYLVKFTIDDKQIQHILQQRQNTNRPLNELIYEEPDQSFQHFQYNCSIQHFKEFQDKHNQNNSYAYIYNPQQIQQKTCKYKYI